MKKSSPHQTLRECYCKEERNDPLITYISENACSSSGTTSAVLAEAVATVGDGDWAVIGAGSCIPGANVYVSIDVRKSPCKLVREFVT
jgi:hypothetical protein